MLFLKTRALPKNFQASAMSHLPARAATSTTETNRSLESQTPPHDIFHDIFPVIKYAPRPSSRFPRALEYAYQSEVALESETFDFHWKCQSVDITDCLMLRERDCEGQLSHVTPELQFAGIPWRLVVDPMKTEGLTSFCRGTTVNYKGSNNSFGKYVVDCCLTEGDSIAYLKVVFITAEQNVYPAFDPKRPAFILIIPAHLNAVSFPSYITPSSDETPLNSALSTTSKDRDLIGWKKFLPSFLSCFAR